MNSRRGRGDPARLSRTRKGLAPRFCQSLIESNEGKKLIIAIKKCIEGLDPLLPWFHR